MEYKITRENKWGTITPIPEGKLAKVLDDKLSYTKPDAHFLPNPMWGIVRLYNKNKGRFPWGLHKKVINIFNKWMLYSGEKYIVEEDFRHVIYKSDTFVSNILYSWQVKAAKAVIDNKGGILSIPTGGGKTIIACELIEHFNFETLVIVPTIDLKRQWRKKINKICETTDKFCDVVTYQSIKNKEQLKGYDVFIMDECLVSNSLISMADGSYKEIKDIICGDMVLSYDFKTQNIVTNRVINTIKKKMDRIYKLTFESNIIECTENHSLYVKREEKVIKVKTSELVVGDLILQQYTNNHIVKHHLTNQQAKFIAMILCDGHIHKDNVYDVRVDTKKDTDFFEYNFYEGVKSFLGDKYKKIRSRNTSYGSIQHSIYSRELQNILVRYGGSRGKKSNVIDIPVNIFYSSLSAIASYVNMCFCCEGYVSNSRKNGIFIEMSSRSERFVQKLKLLLLKFNITSKIRMYLPKKITHSKEYRLTISGINNLTKFYNHIGLDMDRKMEALENLLSSNGLLMDNYTRLNRIEIIDKNVTVYDFEVENTHTFFVNGLLSSNCHHTAAKTIYKIGMNTPNAIMIGLSATPFREDKADLKIEAVLGQIVYKIDTKELIRQGYLCDAEVYYVDCRESKEYYVDYSSAIDNYIVHNEDRNKKIVDIANTELTNGTILILVSRLEHGEILNNMIKGSTFIHGKLSKKKRKEIIDNISNGNIKVVIASTIFDEGIDLPNLQTLILAGGGKSTIKVVQRTGRLLRLFPDKKKAKIYDFIDRTKWLFGHYGKRRRILEKTFKVVDYG